MRTVLGAAVILACGPLFADPLPTEHDLCAQSAQCRMASNRELDALRGGFQLETASGRLHVAIGITRAVAVNDRFVAVSQLVVPDLGGALAGLPQGSRSTQITVPSGQITVTDNAVIVQNGPNNFAPPAAAFGTAAFPTIIQNTLNDQKLGTLTIVNARVNALSVMRALRTGEMMSRATAASGR